MAARITSTKACVINSRMRQEQYQLEKSKTIAEVITDENSLTEVRSVKLRLGSRKRILQRTVAEKKCEQCRC